MFTAKFEAEVENGKIAIPDEYRSAFEKQGSIKVILVRHGKSTPTNDDEDFVQQLLDHPLAIADLVPAHRDDFYSPPTTPDIFQSAQAKPHTRPC